MSKREVKITCKGAGTLGLPLLVPFQGEGAEELKVLSKEDFERLKRELLEDGFSFPVAVWANAPDGKTYILDGHQRVKTLNKMKAEGYSVPELPVVMVEADSFERAKRKLLAAASQYGKVREDGLLAFLKTVSIPAEELVASFRMPEIDLEQFVQDHLLASDQADPLDFEAGAVGEGAPPPSVSGPDFTSAAPGGSVAVAPDVNSQVRMVQLFLNGKTQPEFLQKAARLQEAYETENLTDTIMEVVREAFAALKPN